MTDMLTLSMRVAEEVRVWMVRRRVNQKELARRLDVSAMWVSDRLAGQTQIAVNDLPRIAKALGVKVIDLLPDDVRAGGQTPYYDRLTERPKDNRPPGGPQSRAASDDLRRPTRRDGSPSMARLRRAA